MDLLLPVFQLVYFVVHFLYSLGQAVIDCFYELYHIMSRTFWWKKHYEPNSMQILQDASKLKKLPRHLAIILASKQTNNLNQICYLINWCLGFGIHSLSLYDYEGLLKLKLPSVLDNISMICCNVTVKVIVDGQMYIRECNNTSKSICNNSNRGKGCSAYVSNCKINVPDKLSNLRIREASMPNEKDFANKYRLTLNVLCIEDGKEDIVRIAKNGCDAQDFHVDFEYINSNLITKGQIDPDLAIIVGRPLCSQGFLPWQIRLTEFLSVPSISRLDYFEFRKLLRIYSKCEQRFGS